MKKAPAMPRRHGGAALAGAMAPFNSGIDMQQFIIPGGVCQSPGVSFTAPLVVSDRAGRARLRPSRGAGLGRSLAHPKTEQDQRVRVRRDGRGASRRGLSDDDADALAEPE